MLKVFKGKKKLVFLHKTIKTMILDIYHYILLSSKTIYIKILSNIIDYKTEWKINVCGIQC